MATTAPTDSGARTYLDTVPNERRQRDAIAFLELMQDVTAEPGVMWGPSMAGR